MLICCCLYILLLFSNQTSEQISERAGFFPSFSHFTAREINEWVSSEWGRNGCRVSSESIFNQTYIVCCYVRHNFFFFLNIIIV